MSTAMNPSRKHAYTDAGAAQLPEPTYAERVLSAAESRRELFTRLNDHRDHGC
jgi:hypothetical protein